MATWRVRLNEIIFEADTTAGRRFDVTLLWLILLSVVAVMAESVASTQARWGELLRIIEWSLTALFTVEYLLRLICVRRPVGYIFSFFGVVDLLSVIPTYLSLAFAGAHVLAVVRVLRVLRIFRLMKLSQIAGQAELLATALFASRHKVVVFLVSVVSLVVIIGSLMYLVEGPEHGFTSIPRAVYWAIVTMTTVGYGDIAPQTSLGQTLAALVMILGYAVIAVPTGIVSVELVETTRAMRRARTSRSCPRCGQSEHDEDARYCKSCGEGLEAAT